MSASLSLLASYDELMRCTNILVNGSCEGEFLQFAINQEEMRQKCLASVQECQRLHSALEKAHHEAANLDRKLNHARRLLDEEKKKRRTAEDQRNSCERQITLVKDLLLNDGGRNLNDETREKLQFLNNTSMHGRHNSTSTRDHLHDKLNTITELDSTGSLLSDLSCISRSEDDLDTSIILQQNRKKREWKEHRPSGEYVIKRKRRSGTQQSVDLNGSDRIVATTTLVMPKEGAITASSVIEAIPADENMDPRRKTSQENSRNRRKSSERNSKSKSGSFDHRNAPTPSAPKADIISSNSDAENLFKPNSNTGAYIMDTNIQRSHNFKEKPVMVPHITCIPCGKRIRFGKTAVKCVNCRIVSHSKCRNLVALPCNPTGSTPRARTGMTGTIADFTPRNPPMVPPLVVHCINEVELRGMKEQGLYRVNGGSRDVRILKEKFLRDGATPDLSEVDIATLCSTLKDFLRSLKEPLITCRLWEDFAHASRITDKVDAEVALYQAISELPQPNRDTLAFIILHLQRVSNTPECKMPISNLATVFGPTLVGYSSQEPSQMALLSETGDQVTIVESLLKIPSDYWANFVNPENMNDNPPRAYDLRHTPSADSLTELKRSNSKNFFHTPNTSKLFRRNKKFFATPPSNQKY
ncbi:hypothetical protein QAD02_018766 [Eretmocerus hayati]|uniref:Uncharacterized protein n=1 Tax=Eretmocerus hayati TaxID=131215 RepID=A0ACC2PH99_9HYME|nr:hypothetical protein QAD02_018766 [Eretmocerus hayati]